MDELRKIRYLTAEKEKLLHEIAKFDANIVDKLMLKLAGHSREWEASIFTLSFIVGILKGMTEKNRTILKKW